MPFDAGHDEIERLVATATTNAWAAVTPTLSRTCTVIGKLPDTVGTPLIKPLLESTSPAGRFPAVNDHAYGGTPPPAPSCAWYGCDCVAFSRFDVVTASSAMFVSEKPAVVETPAALATTLYVPAIAFAVNAGDVAWPVWSVVTDAAFDAPK